MDGFRRKAAQRVEARDGRNQMELPLQLAKNTSEKGHCPNWTLGPQKIIFYSTILLYNIAMKTNVLIVDNDESLIKVLGDFLSKEPLFDVFTALNGKEAEEIAKNHKVDLAIVDLKMPEISGVELLASLKKNLPDIKSIILTGHSNIDSYIETMELGACEYLNKPVDLHLLKKVIDKLL